MSREQTGHVRKRPRSAMYKAIGTVADTPRWEAVPAAAVSRAPAAGSRPSAAGAERPHLRVSARLRVAAGLDIMAQFACVGLLRDAWDLWQEKLQERRAAWVAVQEAEARVRALVESLAERPASWRRPASWEGGPAIHAVFNLRRVVSASGRVRRLPGVRLELLLRSRWRAAALVLAARLPEPRLKGGGADSCPLRDVTRLLFPPQGWQSLECVCCNKISFSNFFFSHFRFP